MFSRFSLEKVIHNNPDVLIIDRNGIEFVEKCIPLEYIRASINIRTKIPYMTGYKFVLRFFLNIYKYGLNHLALMVSIIEILKPNAIITFTDNIRIMGQISQIFPDKLVLSIQNGVRTLPDDFVSDKGDFNLPIYFSFGEYEKDLLKYLNVPYKELHQVGSIKLSLFLSQLPENNNENSICFISQYIHSLEISRSQIARDCILRMEAIFRNLLNCSNSKKINIVMRNSRKNLDFKNEKDFYLNLSKNANLIENDERNFTSYKVAFSSSIIIAMDSTLAFEMFGSGKRVLFCDLAKDKLFVNRKGVNFLFKKIPNELVLETFDMTEMQSKINSIIEMTDEQYLKLTKASRAYYLRKTDIPANQIISSYLKDNLTNHPGKYV